jgi:hypothetical protein
MDGIPPSTHSEFGLILWGVIMRMISIKPILNNRKKTTTFSISGIA